MTAARQERKARRPLWMWTAALAFWLALAAVLPGRPGAATTERVVADRHTGLAISGFDPVAYFTEGRPAEGRAEIELALAGAVWRFRNEGNRDAFARDPDVYLPRYGGYDPVAVARGASAPGHPEIWLVRGGRLYLFRSAQARGVFEQDPAGMARAADRRWPQVMQTLVP